MTPTSFSPYPEERTPVSDDVADVDDNMIISRILKTKLELLKIWYQKIIPVLKGHTARTTIKVICAAKHLENL